MGGVLWISSMIRDPIPQLFAYEIPSTVHSDPTDVYYIRCDRFKFDYHTFEGRTGMIFDLNKTND